MNEIRVFLIDDHHVMRQGVAAMLNDAVDITVVGDSGDPREGIDAATKICPDVVLVDLKMPNMNGLAVIAEILAARPGVGVIVFTMHDNPSYVWETMNAGARGYVLKSADKADLLRAVRAVASGAGYLQAEVTLPVLKRLSRDARSADSRATLTSRELQILECLADGQSNKVIAATLTITEATVKSHLKKLYDKIGAADRAHAVAIALRGCLIE